MEYDPKEINKLYEELDTILNKYGLQIAFSIGEFMHPISIQITVEEADDER